MSLPLCEAYNPIPSALPDKFGRPVYIELLGRTDATALFETITTERLIRYHIWTWERYLRRYLPACSAAAGRTICTTTVIIDLAGLSLAHFNTATQKLLNTFSKIDQVRWAGLAGLSAVMPVCARRPARLSYGMYRSRRPTVFAQSLTCTAAATHRVSPLKFDPFAFCRGDGS